MFQEPPRALNALRLNTRSTPGHAAGERAERSRRPGSLRALSVRRQDFGVFVTEGAAAGNGFTLSDEGEPEAVIGQLATPALFDVLGRRRRPEPSGRAANNSAPAPKRWQRPGPAIVHLPASERSRGEATDGQR
jgi:hypothetical protein